jgi:hypothetical protein
MEPVLPQPRLEAELVPAGSPCEGLHPPDRTWSGIRTHASSPSSGSSVTRVRATAWAIRGSSRNGRRRHVFVVTRKASPGASTRGGRAMAADLSGSL